MLIGMRNAMMSGKQLPYDSEVEYLESTGTQWINTGVKSVFPLNASLTIQVVLGGGIASSSSIMILGVRIYPANNGNHFGYWYNKQNGRPAIAYGRYDPGFFSVGDLSVGPATLSNEGAAFFYNGEPVLDGGSPVTVDRPTAPIYLFAMNDSNVAQTRNGDKKIFHFKLSNGLGHKVDFTPVRFTNEQNQTEGAMYDRVSGELFRNAGTGAFIIGPDKVSSVRGGV